MVIFTIDLVRDYYAYQEAVSLGFSGTYSIFLIADILFFGISIGIGVLLAYTLKDKYKKKA